MPLRSSDLYPWNYAFDLYLYAVYWGFASITTVGYGDIVPTSEVEMMCTVLADSTSRKSS